MLYNSLSKVEILITFVLELSISSGAHFNNAALICFLAGIPNLS
jgi:hypothetical protein